MRQVTVTPEISHFAAEVHARWVVNGARTKTHQPFQCIRGCHLEWPNLKLLAPDGRD
ncbi:hypothetical protein KFU94_61340 [Chloroflexi bacterium TSY]|nr:hypothetical protein [Chloroflexi bacterium TSY]